MAPRLTLPTAEPAAGGGNRARQISAGGSGLGGGQQTSLGDVTRGLNELSDVISQIGFQRDSVASVSVEARLNIEAMQKQEALNPLDPKYQENVKAIWDDAKRQAGESGITNSQVSADLQRRMERTAAGQQIASIGVAKAAVGKEAVRVYGEAMDATRAKIRSDPDNYNLYVTEFQGDAERLKTGIKQEDLPKLASMFADSVTKARVAGYAEKGQLGKAREVLNGERQGLSDSDFNTLSAYIDGKENKMRAAAAHAQAENTRAQNNNAANILVGLSDQAAGVKPYDENNRANIEAAYAKGQINAQGRLAAIDHDNAILKKMKHEEMLNQQALDAFKNNVVSSQDQADRAFKAMNANLPFGQIATSGTAEQWNQAATIAQALAAQGKFLPTEVNALVTNADSKTNKEDATFVARAAKLADDIDATGGKAQFALKDSGTVNVVRAAAKRYMNQGMTKEEAYVEAAKAEMGKGPLTIQQEKDREEQVTRQLSTMRTKGEIDAEVKNALKDNTTTGESLNPFKSAPGVDSAASGVYERALKEASRATNDPELQKQIARNAVAKEFGRSDANGKPTNVFMPPERELPPSATFFTQDQRAAYIKQDVENTLKARGIELPKEGPADLPGLPPWRLVATDKSINDKQNRRESIGGYQIQIWNSKRQDYVNVGTYRTPTDAEMRESDLFKSYEAERVSASMKARQAELDKAAGNTDKKLLQQKSRDLLQQYTPQSIPGR